MTTRLTATGTRWAPITADDATIEAALREAYVPLLVVTLVHLTGDPSILRGAPTPTSGRSSASRRAASPSRTRRRSVRSRSMS